MGCDIHIQAQKRDGGKWVEVTGGFAEGPAPFDWRCYGLFAFLAGVRNYSAITPVSEPRGLPDDHGAEDEWEFGDHSYSWLSVEELAAVNYEQEIEDRRCTRQIAANVWAGAETCDPGEGKLMVLKEFLGDGFMSDLARLQELGAERVVFGFDS